MINLFSPYIDETTTNEIHQVIQSGAIAQGEKVTEFERQLATYTGAKWAATVNSGTSALHLALHLIKTKYNLQDHHHIISTPLTCAATNLPILANGLQVKWADVDPDTCNISCEDLIKKVNHNTGAIMVVHWGGLPVNIFKRRQMLFEIGKPVPIIEDCAHAFGTFHNNVHVGTNGTYGCFSFQAIKTLTTGDGGMLICPDEPENKRARLLRWFGLDRDGGATFRAYQDIEHWGFKFQMNNIAAAMGLCNLKTVEARVKSANITAAIYDSELSNVAGVNMLRQNNPCNARSSSWLYTMLVDNRAEFIKKMAEAGIEANPVHARNDQLSCMKEFKADLPQLDSIYDRIVCIPIGWWVSPEDAMHIVTTIKSGW